MTFILSYKNVGEKAIKVDMEVQCISASRAEPENGKHWQKWSAQNFIFKIAPGETHEVRGRLQWYADTKLIPR